MVAQAAELLAVLARQAGRDDATTRAESIRARASALALSNELAFTRASRQLDAALRGQSDDLTLTQAATSAADGPLRICQAANDLTLLAAELAAGPMSQRSADLCGIAQLAAGACNAAALLVRANSALAADDPRRSRADESASATYAAARAMLAGPAR
jgi:formiminotetrahydrofolate cyclodeaminase